MKTITISAVFIIMNITSLAQNNCPSSFKRNNGNGTCNSLGELRLYFPSISAEGPPIIDSVLIEGVKSPVSFNLPETEQSPGNNEYASYCVVSGNMPPANVWAVYFHTAEAGAYMCTIFSSSSGPLAVKYYSFDASITKDHVVICNWITEEEINNNYFELERSFDGINYSTTALIFSAENNTGSLQSYQYKDKAAALKNKHLVYYRLKQVDKDGSASYSKVVSVKLKSDLVNFLQISPNPFVESIRIKLEAVETGYATTKIMNASGQTISSTKASINKGSNDLQVSNLNGLSKGVYVIQVSVNGVINGKQKIIKN